jgi:dienelactone hydrolase
MSIILVTDVFGITPALLQLKDKLEANTIIDPYKGKSMAFNNEAEAYSCFMSTVGLDKYVSKVFTALASIDSQTTLIGFSVGASAIWRLPINNKNNIIKQAFCFYGSQIRNFTKIIPYFKTHLVFPKSESHFDVSKLNDELTKKNNVITTQVDYLHGFMNYYSSNFNQVGYDQHVALLRSNTN